MIDVSVCVGGLPIDDVQGETWFDGDIRERAFIVGGLSDVVPPPIDEEGLAVGS